MSLSLSYGKDSLACLAVIDELCLPLDGIVHAEVWATQDIPADLPPMIEFKKHADEIIKRRWGIEVEHICAMQKPPRSQTVNVERDRERESESDGECHQRRISYADMFYRRNAGGKVVGAYKGFPQTIAG